jgi:hypothetical protein
VKPHKYADVIKAWADGAKLQSKLAGNPDGIWIDNDFIPFWDSQTLEYRIKPTVITHDLRVTWDSIMNLPVQDSGIPRNLRLTFTDGVLTDASVIKE